MSNTTPVHISVVFDRSGSMASIADDIVGGFNTFLDQQRRETATPGSFWFSSTPRIHSRSSATAKT
jgi:hypothetical protein